MTHSAVPIPIWNDLHETPAPGKSQQDTPCRGSRMTAKVRFGCGGADRARRRSGLPSIADILLRCREPPLGASNGLSHCKKVGKI